MKDELISIIVPVYNVENYLDRCVESIINQTYQNIEILLMDDASTDASSVICDKWSAKDNRIRVFHLPHGGVAAARNKGLEEMKGRYILFVDSDDYITPDLIAVTYNNLCQHDADMAMFDMANFYSAEEKPNVSREGKVSVIDKMKILYMMYEKPVELAFIVTCKLYRCAVFEGIVFPIGRIYEDNAIVHKIYEKCQRIVYDENVYYLRQCRDDSIMAKSLQFSRKNLVILYAQKERCELYDGLQDKRLLAMIYAEYLHTLIHLYYKTEYLLKDREICDRLRDEFRTMYSIAKKKVRFDLKKEVGYWGFRYFTRTVSFLMYVLYKGKR